MSIKIIGHKNPDIDSIISGILFEYYCTLNNINAKYIIPDNKVSEDNLTILNYLNIKYESFYGEIKDEDTLILLDHHNTKYNNEIIGCIDHHPEFFTNENTINIKSSSTAKIIYDYLLKDYNLQKTHYEMIILSILVDTSNFKSSKTVLSDKDFVINISKKYNFRLKYLENLSNCLTNIDNYNCIYNGRKDYLMDDKKIMSSYIQVENISKDKMCQIENNIKCNYKDLFYFYYLWFFIIIDIERNESFLYEFYNDKIISTNYFNKLLSRGNDVIPYLEEKFNKKIISI